MRSFFRLAWKLSSTALMLLCQGRLLVGVVKVGDEQGKEASGDVAHQAPPDLLGALALGGAAGDVVAGLGVMDHAVVAISQSALLPWRSPPRLRRCLVVLRVSSRFGGDGRLRMGA